ncbi:ribosome biogenesis GTPase Der [Cerasicoccus arenae]|uniref:GTPase Der n=1 Tax=Cerasicoccus arenae TaxID=424488 RepID=A0A8J3D6W6_9BACT|nr:ribosome biogenesis GTPase Der [Cerasicoccus arenae]MBK1857746.1 ribosome biogenesis GTPase Der [Cerasicoccus arenae]GHB91046.1 GTPase Der [Cerasicoccus arenae]
MISNRTVALVGRPNVGKSRLFNRLLGKRVAIVHDMPGVTRDLAMAVVDEDFLIMDTGGIGIKPEMTPAAIHEATEEQVELAIQAANLVLFVVEGPEGVTPVDLDVADMLRRSGKEVLTVVNKIDRQSGALNLAEFHRMGFRDVLAVSAEHGQGSRELFDAITEFLGPKPEAPEVDEDRRINICLCGRPNVGKSSLGNALIRAPRLIVSDIAGTTRDAIEHELDYTAKTGEEWKFRLIDTAGMKPNRKLGSSLDYFSNLRSSGAIERADVAFLILDALSGVAKHDKKIAGEIADAGVGLVVVVNKWDLALDSFRQSKVDGFTSEKEFRKAFIDAIREELFFLPNSPIIFTSALTGFQVDEILKSAVMVDTTLGMELPTAQVNKVLGDMLERQKPKIVGGRRFKVYYGLQVAQRPFKIRLFCNREEKLEDSYLRYLENGFHKNFRLDGCPVKFDLRGKSAENPYYTPNTSQNKGNNALNKHGKGTPRRPMRRSRKK